MSVFLDHNATSPLRPEARAIMLEALGHAGNASSVHADGRRARQTIDMARRNVAALAGTVATNIVFTSGATEANALALGGAISAAASAGQRITRLIVSSIEHESITANAALCEETFPGVRVSTCPVTAQGVLDLVALKQILSEGKGRALVSVMAVNNETGIIQPVGEAAKLARDNGALFHCDAVQAAGKIPLEFDGAGFDYLTLSSHKIGGPQGAGALAVRAGAPMSARQRGGMQETALRAGTENVAALAGFGSAAQDAVSQLGEMSRWHTRRAALESHLRVACADAVIVGGDASRVGNTVCVAAPGISAETMVIALDLDGFSVSAGSACSSGKMSASHVLAAMHAEPSTAQAAIRVSFGWNTSDEELDRFAEAWGRVVKRARARAAA